MASGKPIRKQPSSGAWLNTGWMDKQRTVRSEVTDTGKRADDDLTYHQCDSSVVNEASDALINAVSSLTLRDDTDS